ncbi:MAG: DUF3854 domain-containing protein [Armatimonadetes bacterium]|nr:DUF3854 domain-containing protein [Armatimonadota bacterium]
MALSEHHRKMLEEGSAISPRILAEAGVCTLSTKAELKAIGFPNAVGSALAFPVLTWSSGNDPEYWRIRPDNPKPDRRGKTAKYLQPRGTDCRLYCLPTARRLIGGLQGISEQDRPAQPYLFVTEGEKKTLALLSKNLAAVGLAGVWNWRRKAILRGDFDVIGLHGMDICIVYDSDSATNAHVAKAEDALAAMLQSAGARVFRVQLPAGPDGQKVGIDDFFAGGGTVDELAALVKPYTPRAHTLEDRYREHEGRLERYIPPSSTGNDGYYEAITQNYVAYVTADKVVDDGIEERRCFTVEGQMQNGRPLPPVDVPASQFNSWSWVSPKWGVGPRLIVGQNAEKHACAAALYISGDEVQEIRVYSHTGWRAIDGRNVYIHAGGAIGSDGNDSSVQTQFEQVLQPYVLPEPPDIERLSAALASAIDVFRIAPARIIGPLWAAVWRAVLGESYFSLFLVGPTGSRKSSLSAVISSYYGNGLSRKERLPLSWSSTDNALEAACFSGKDALVVIDDFVPGRGSLADRQTLQRKASRLLRAAGNGSGRQRMRADGTLMSPRPPRALILSTGEELPEGGSELRRTVVVEVALDDVNLAALTLAQSHAEDGTLALCMAGFVVWAAGRLEELRARIRAASLAGRDGTRIKETEAELMEAARIWGDYAIENGLSATEAQGIVSAAVWGIEETAREQAMVDADQDPVLRFFELLADGIASGEVYLLPRNACKDQTDRIGRHIGWKDDDSIYLIPSVAYAAVTRLGEAAGRPVQQGSKSLWKLMKQRGMLVLQGQGDRSTRKLAFGPWGNVGVIQFAASLLDVESGSIERNGSPSSLAKSDGDSDLPISAPEAAVLMKESGGDKGNPDAPAGLLNEHPPDPPATPVSEKNKVSLANVESESHEATSLFEDDLVRTEVRF